MHSEIRFLQNLFIPLFSKVQVFWEDHQNWVQSSSSFDIILESGIDVAPGIKVALPLKDFNMRILIHFYTNQDIAVMFLFFSLYSFSKINKRTPTLIPDSRVLSNVSKIAPIFCGLLKYNKLNKANKEAKQTPGLTPDNRYV